MAALRTEQLDYLIRHLAMRVGRVFALGAFPADCMPSIARFGTTDSCFIMNTDPRDRPGQHWLAFYYSARDDLLEYFDSFGLPLSSYPVVLHSVKRRKIRIRVVNDTMVQSPYSTACGYFCILFLYRRAWLSDRGKDVVVWLLRKLASRYHTSTHLDDSVVAMVHKLIHDYHCANMPCSANCTRFSQTCVCKYQQ